MFEEIEVKSISKEKYETVVKPIVVDYIKSNCVEFYNEYSEKGEKWMITRIENKWYWKSWLRWIRLKNRETLGAKPFHGFFIVFGVTFIYRVSI